MEYERLRNGSDFDTVIIGSGFGGAVTAETLAPGNQKLEPDKKERRVCLLERGKKYPPGSFPRTPAGYAKNVWDPRAGKWGMFQIWRFKRFGGVVASGLGGGSLIYANVLLRKDESWFVSRSGADGGENWPLQRADLEPHYDAVEGMMKPERFTSKTSSKTNALRTVAANDPTMREIPVPLAITFKEYPNQQFDDGSDNYHGKPRSSCRLCGECDVGCNTGSKNSLDFNYITSAAKKGVEVYALTEVKGLKKLSDGRFEVRYVHYDPDESALPEEGKITARRVVLAAGTFATTHLLLKCRKDLDLAELPIGERFSSNGDVLSFVADAPTKPYNFDAPVVTTALHVKDELDGARKGTRGHYVEDACVPEWASWAFEAGDIRRWLRRGLRFLRRVIFPARVLDTDLSSEVAALIGPAKASTHLLPLLIMGRDAPTGRMFLDEKSKGKRKEELQLDWNPKDSRDYYKSVERTARKIATELKGKYKDNTFTKYFRAHVTVHPLGGCAMATSSADGVVDTYGRVFGCENLYVADGSVMPGSVGPNPAFTIAALAHRFATQMVADDKSGTLKWPSANILAAEAAE